MDILLHFEQIIKTAISPIIFEIGINDGYHSNILNNIVKKYHNVNSFQYHAFEPDIRLTPQITNMLANNPNIHFQPIAIGGKNGTVDFYLSSGVETRPTHVKQHFSGSSSIRKPKLVTTAWPDMKFESTKVTCKNIEQLSKELNLTKIDFIWMDTQGAEIDIFGGLGEFYKNIHFIFTEYCNSELYEGSVGLNKICELLPTFKIIENYGGDVLLENTEWKVK